MFGLFNPGFPQQSTPFFKSESRDGGHEPERFKRELFIDHAQFLLESFVQIGKNIDQ
jgi:hypothetical protein